MYRNCPEDPRIASALRTGHPPYIDTSEDEYDDFGLTGTEDDEEGERE